eukprot:augustus_masked-scaffold_52-processed-gene-1.10-mRNA-1 protein AED:1.00 eAED:1.00 QI:0/-1/0/0/-1/1/1/0/336
MRAVQKTIQRVKSFTESKTVDNLFSIPVSDSRLVYVRFRPGRKVLKTHNPHNFTPICVNQLPPNFKPSVLAFNFLETQSIDLQFESSVKLTSSTHKYSHNSLIRLNQHKIEIYAPPRRHTVISKAFRGASFDNDIPVKKTIKLSLMTSMDKEIDLSPIQSAPGGIKHELNISHLHFIEKKLVKPGVYNIEMLFYDPVVDFGSGFVRFSICGLDEEGSSKTLEMINLMIKNMITCFEGIVQSSLKDKLLSVESHLKLEKFYRSVCDLTVLLDEENSIKAVNAKKELIKYLKSKIKDVPDEKEDILAEISYWQDRVELAELILEGSEKDGTAVQGICL